LRPKPLSEERLDMNGVQSLNLCQKKGWILRPEPKPLSEERLDIEARALTFVRRKAGY